MGKIAKIRKLQNQLNTLSKRFYFVKKILLIVATVVTLINVYILFYSFNSIVLAIKISSGFFSVIIIGIVLYRNQLKFDTQKIEFLIYQELKL